jgi:uncharacterized protein (DUF2141 family)
MTFSCSVKVKLMRNLLIIAYVFFIQTPNHFPQIESYGAQLGKIIITIVGFENDDGDCRFAINNSEELHEREDTVFIGLVLPIVNRTVEVVIDSLPYGWYAIKVLHDENQNTKLDKNFLGIPTENYGYSNNASGWFGPPRWEKAKFLLDQEELRMEITVD